MYRQKIQKSWRRGHYITAWKFKKNLPLKTGGWIVKLEALSPTLPCSPHEHWGISVRTHHPPLFLPNQETTKGVLRPVSVPSVFLLLMKRCPCQSKLLSAETDKYHSRRQLEPWMCDAYILLLSHPFPCWSGLPMSASSEWDLMHMVTSCFQHVLDGSSFWLNFSQWFWH